MCLMSDVCVSCIQQIRHQKETKTYVENANIKCKQKMYKKKQQQTKITAINQRSEAKLTMHWTRDPVNFVVVSKRSSNILNKALPTDLQHVMK